MPELASFQVFTFEKNASWRAELQLLLGGRFALAATFAAFVLGRLGGAGIRGFFGFVGLLIREDFLPEFLDRIIVDVVDHPGALLAYLGEFTGQGRMQVVGIHQADDVHAVGHRRQVLVALGRSRGGIVHRDEDDLVLARLVIPERLQVLLVELGILLLKRRIVDVEAFGLRPVAARRKREDCNGYGREQKFLDISFHNRLAFGLVII